MKVGDGENDVTRSLVASLALARRQVPCMMPSKRSVSGL